MAIPRKKPVVSAPGKSGSLNEMPPFPPANPALGSPYGALPLNAPKPAAYVPGPARQSLPGQVDTSGPAAAPLQPPGPHPSGPAPQGLGTTGAGQNIHSTLHNFLTGPNSRAGRAAAAMAPGPAPSVSATTGIAAMGGGMQIPPSGRPDLSQLGHAGQNLGFTPPGVSPFSPPASPAPMGPLFSGELPTRPDFPHLPMHAPSEQPMVNGPGYSAPPPQGVQFGPPVPPHYDPQAPIRALQNMGVIGSRVGEEGKGPGPMPPLAAALLGSRNPITGPTGQSMATDTAHKTPGGLLSDFQAAQNYRNSPADSRYMPNTTAGGRFGQPAPSERTAEDPKLAAAKANGFKKEATPVGGYAKTQSEFDQRMKNENPMGAFGGTLPVKGPDGRVVYADGPMRDFGLTNSGKFNEGGKRKEAYSQSELDKIRAAKDKLNSPERKAYLDKRASQVADRKAATSGRAQEKAIAHQQTRAFNKGVMDNNTRFAFQNPRAAAARDVGLANADAVKGNNAARLALDEKRINSAENIAKNRDAANVQASQNRILAQLPPGSPNPFEKPEQAAPAKQPSNQDIRLMPKADGYASLREHYGAAEANRVMNEIHGTNDWNYEQYPNGPTIASELFGSGNRVEPVAPPPPPPVGSSGRARMGGGMQLPTKKPKGSNPYADNIGQRWGGYMN